MEPVACHWFSVGRAEPFLDSHCRSQTGELAGLTMSPVLTDRQTDSDPVDPRHTKTSFRPAAEEIGGIIGVCLSRDSFLTLNPRCSCVTRGGRCESVALSNRKLRLDERTGHPEFKNSRHTRINPSEVIPQSAGDRRTFPSTKTFADPGDRLAQSDPPVKCHAFPWQKPAYEAQKPVFTDQSNASRSPFPSSPLLKPSEISVGSLWIQTQGIKPSFCLMGTQRLPALVRDRRIPIIRRFRTDWIGGFRIHMPKVHYLAGIGCVSVRTENLISGYEKEHA
ncbi:unnamed protein product [Leuciscus chuanchicus]